MKIYIRHKDGKPSPTEPFRRIVHAAEYLMSIYRRRKDVEPMGKITRQSLKEYTDRVSILIVDHSEHLKEMEYKE